MKVVHYVEHPTYKITIFKSGFKYIVKFDSPEFDYSYKFLDGEVDDLSSLIDLVEEILIHKASDCFANMRAIKRDLLQRAQEKSGTDDSIEII